ncbi:hypothetical protein [Cupriavidus sp. RAF12]|uniref:hypothetical protein n=1 Tax=Cupriavidus sp. RAF12 TaxID=3233050 RepID=UPI003F8E32B0
MKAEALARLMYAFFAGAVLMSSALAHSVMLLVLAGCVLVLSLDYLINDVLPEGFHWPWAIARRAQMYVVLAFIYVSQLYVATLLRVDLGWQSYVLFISMAVFGLVLGFKEALHARGMRCLN